MERGKWRRRKKDGGVELNRRMEDGRWIRRMKN